MSKKHLTFDDRLAIQAGLQLCIIFIGFHFLASYNIYTAILRGIGDSRVMFFPYPFIHAKCSFRYFFVYLYTRVQGAAMITILSQIVMTIFIMIYGTRKYKWLRFRFSRKIFSFRAIKEEGSFEFPPMLQSCISSLGGLIL